MRLMESPRLLLALAMLCWAGNWVVGRAMHGVIPPFTLNFWRWAGSLVVILPLAGSALRREWWLLLRHWKWVFPMAAIGASVFQSLIYLGLQSTTALNGALINAAVPVFVVLIAWPVLGAGISPRQFAGIAVSLVGVVLILVRGEWSVLRALRFNPGDLWILGAMPLWSLYTVLTKRWPAGLSRMTFLAALAGIGAVCQFPLFLLEVGTGRVMHVTPGSLAAIVYVALFASFLAYVFYNTAMERAAPAVAGLFHHLHPAFTAALGMIFLGERMAWFHGAGVLLIASGLYLASATRPAAVHASRPVRLDPPACP